MSRASKPIARARRAPLLIAVLVVIAPARAVTWTELSPSVSPGARESHVMEYDPLNERVILFGGANLPVATYADTWQLDLATGLWTQLSPASSPTVRFYAASTTDGTGMYLFGGTANGVSVAFDEMWLFDYATSSWTNVTPAMSPAPRFDHRMIWDPATSRSIVFGGFAPGFVPFGDLWAHDPASGLWSQLPSPAPAPPPRTNFFFGSAGNGTIYLYAGHDDTTTLSDSWAYDLAAGTWRSLNPPIVPTPREHQASFALDSTGRLYQWSGDVQDDMDDRAELWAFSPATEQWTNLTPEAGSPAPRRHSAVAADRATGRAFAFGGFDASVTFGDTQILTDMDPGTVLFATGGAPTPTGISEVRTFEAARLPVRRSAFSPYGTVGALVNVASADLEADGSDDIVTGPGPSPVFGPHVRAFRQDGTSLSKLNLYAYGTLRFGAKVGAANLDVDPADEVLTGAGPGAVFGPHVRGFDLGGSPLPGLSFYAYSTLRYGVNPAGGSVGGVGFDDVVTGPGPGAVFGAHVRGFRYTGSSVQAIGSLSFFAFTSRYGALVSLGSVDADPEAELVAATGPDPAAAGVAIFDVGGGAPTSIAAASVRVVGSTVIDWDPAAAGGELLLSTPTGDLGGYRVAGGGLVSIPELSFSPYGGAPAAVAGGTY